MPRLTESLSRVARLRTDILWALDAAARSPQARKAMRRTAYVHSTALAVVAALLVHAAAHGLR